jgi:hypothetical protein
MPELRLFNHSIIWSRNSFEWKFLWNIHINNTANKISPRLSEMNGHGSQNQRQCWLGPAVIYWTGQSESVGTHSSWLAISIPLLEAPMKLQLVKI